MSDLGSRLTPNELLQVTSTRFYLAQVSNTIIESDLFIFKFPICHRRQSAKSGSSDDDDIDDFACIPGFLIQSTPPE